MEQKYLDIINNQDLWTSIQLAESFAVETSLGESKLDLSQIKDGIVTYEDEISQESIENTEFSYWDSNGEERVMKINPCLETSRNIYQLLFERVLKAEDYITIASSIKENLKDKDWALNICKTAHSRCLTIWDYDKTIKMFIDLLFPSVFCQETKKYRRFQNINQDHKDLLKIMISEAKQISVQTIDFLRVAELVVHYELEEIFADTLDPILEKASDKSRSVSDMLDIAYFYLTWIKEEKKQDARKQADVYFKKAEDLSVDSEDYKAIAEKLCEALDSAEEELEEYINLKYRDWMRQLLNMAAKTSFLSYERDNLIYFSQDLYGLNDPELTRILKKEFTNHPILVHKNNLLQSTIDKITQMDSRYEVLTLSDELCDNNQKDEARELLRLCELCSYRPSDLISLADNISNENCLSDSEWATEVYKKAISFSYSTSDLLGLAHRISDEYGPFKDNKWAKEILVKALDLCVTFDDYNRLSNDIYLACADSKWALEVLSTSEKYARTSFDFKELGAHYSGGYNTDSVDMKKAKDFFNIAVEKIQENIDLYEITRHVSQDLKDEKWAKELCEMQLESNKGFHSLDSYALVNLANLVNVNLNDKDFAKQIFTKALEISNNDNDAVDYILGEIENEWGYNDQDLAAKFRTKYKK